MDEYLAACIQNALVVKGPILECGSGLSSLVVGAIAKQQGIERRRDTIRIDRPSDDGSVPSHGILEDLRHYGSQSPSHAPAALGSHGRKTS